MFYCKWTEKDIRGLKSVDNMVILYTEIDSDGFTTREIGLDNENKIVHKCPSGICSHGTYGLFDNQKVVVTEGRSDISKEFFEKLWEWTGEKIDFEIE